MKKIICGFFIILVGICRADFLLLQDTFDTANGQDINADLASRQSGTEATSTWTDTAANNWTTQIYGAALRLYKSGATGGSVFAELGKDFATVSMDVRIAVDVQNMYPGDGFSMINIGMAAADGLSANAGYSFRLDARTGTSFLKFYDSGVQKGSMDVDVLADGGLESLVIDFSGGNALSATFNGTAFYFGSGQTSYTGTSELENHIMLGWYGDGAPSLTSAQFDNLSVTSIPEPATLGLVLSASLGLLFIRRMKTR